MPPKDLAPFTYIYPTQNPLLMIKYELSTSCHWCFLSWVQLHQWTGSAKNWPIQKSCYATPRKIPFINAVSTFLWVSMKCVWNIMVTVSVRVSVTVRVSLVWFVSGNMYVSPAGKWNISLCCKFGGIADLRNYAPKIAGHSIGLCYEMWEHMKCSSMHWKCIARKFLILF